MTLRAVYPLSGLNEISRLSTVDIQKLLRIPINQRKPAALHLNHDPVPLPQRVEDIGHTEFKGRYLSGRKRLRI
jgi:hypothetical protein